MTAIEVDETVVVTDTGPRIGWGWYLAAGLAWIVIGLSILSFNPGTISLISWLVAFVVILAGVMEFAYAFVSDGWRWLHALAGIVFVVVGCMAFVQPMQTFAALALLFGWYLVIKGTVLTVVSIAAREPGSLWGLGLFVGLLTIAIGLWAIGYPGRSAWLLVFWIGIGAIMHGIGDIMAAFEARRA